MPELVGYQYLITRCIHSKSPQAHHTVCRKPNDKKNFVQTSCTCSPCEICVDSEPQPNHIKAKQYALKQAPRIVAYCVPNTDQNRAKGLNESVAKPGGSGKTTKEVAVDQKANPIKSAQAVLLSDGDITKSVKVKHISLNPLAAKIGKNKVSIWQTVPYGHRMCTDCFKSWVITNSGAYPGISGHGGGGQGFHRDSVFAHRFLTKRCRPNTHLF